MTTQSLRFLCAGGFHLHAVLDGIPDVPESLLEILTAAPYRAAEQVFQAALREEVDFVVLTGDLLDAASGGPRAVAFLRKQFELLHDNGIPVYWSASELDLSSDWLQHIDLPRNVHVFADDLVEQKQVLVNDRPAALVTGRSWNSQRPLRAGEYATGTTELRQIAVLYGPCDFDDLPPRVGFWATGGASATATSTVGKQVVHGPGWPQGFRASQSGAHGCTLVQMDGAGEVRMRRVETDAVRWARERLLIADGASLSDIRQALRLRVQKLLADSDRLVLVEWSLAGDGWFHSPLVHASRRAELLEWLREEFGQGTHPAWSISLEIEIPERIRDEWTDEDSILGDYLRVAREYLEEENRPLTLDLPAAAGQLPSALQTLLPIGQGAVRAEIVRESALLGIGLLRGEDRTVAAFESAGRED